MAFAHCIQLGLNRVRAYMIMVVDFPNCYESVFWTFTTMEWNERNATSIKTQRRCSAIFRKWKILQTQHYKFRTAAKTFVRRDCSSGWPTIKVSDLKMYKGRPCHWWQRKRFRQQVPLEQIRSQKPMNVEHINFFLDKIRDLPPTTIQFPCRKQCRENYNEPLWKCTTRRYTGDMKFRDTHQTLILPSTFYTRCRE